MSDIRVNRWLHQSGTGGVYQDSSGRVGIGTSVPTSALDVQSGTIKIGSNTLSSSGVSTFTNIVVSAGSTSAPSISPTGDSNTGIFFPSPDTVAIGEGGVEVLRVDSSSNVGINTANPTDKLTILGKIQVQQDSGSNNRIILRAQPSSSYRWNIDNYSSSNIFRIFREDDGTSASGATAIQIDPVTRNVSINGGNLVFDSGKGIDFSATANSSGTMTSELLNDYEEGTWTPVMLGNSVAGSWSGNSANGGFYIKIGRQVTAWANVNGTLSGASGNMRVSGIPFNRSPNSTPSGSGNSMYSTGAIQYWSGISVQAMGPLIEPSNLLYFHTYVTNSTSGADVPATNASHNLHFFITYFTA